MMYSNKIVVHIKQTFYNNVVALFDYFFKKKIKHIFLYVFENYNSDSELLKKIIKNRYAV